MITIFTRRTAISGYSSGQKPKTYYCTGCQKQIGSGQSWCSENCRQYVHLLHRKYGGERFAPHELRLFVLERDGFRCCICRCSVTNDTANIDHIKPWPLGRTNPSNLAAICRACNKAKSNFVGLALHTTAGNRRYVAFDKSLRRKAGVTVAEWVGGGLGTSRVGGTMPKKMARKYTPGPLPETPFLPRDCMECRVTQRLCPMHL